MIKSRKRQLTFMEVMIALMLISCGILPLIVLFTGSHKQTAVARDALTVIYIARTLIDEVKATPFYRLKSRNSTDFVKVEGLMIPTQLMASGIDKTYLKWPEWYGKFSYNLKLIPIKELQTGRDVAFKVKLTIRWKDKMKEKKLHFGSIVARTAR